MITVDVIQDFICPWCLVGERRLAAAIAGLPDPGAVRVRHLPFELNPGMPPEGVDRRAYRTAKFGSWEHSQRLDAQTAAAAAPDGVAFAYDRIARTPNTRRAHRLMALAADKGVAGALSAALLSGYFERGLDIGDPEVLATLAVGAGLDRGEAERFLAGDGGTDEVLAAEAAVLASGVASVPAFRIGDRILSGAQPVRVLRAALLAALEGDDGRAAAAAAE